MNDVWYNLNSNSAIKYGLQHIDMNPYKTNHGSYNMGGRVLIRQTNCVIPDYISIIDNKVITKYGVTDILGPLDISNNTMLDFAELCGNIPSSGIHTTQEQVNRIFPTNKDGVRYDKFACKEANAYVINYLFECRKEFIYDSWYFYDKFNKSIRVPLLSSIINGELISNSTLLLNNEGNGNEIGSYKHYCGASGPQTVVGLLLGKNETRLITKSESEVIEIGRYLGNTIYNIQFETLSRLPWT